MEDHPAMQAVKVKEEAASEPAAEAAAAAHLAALQQQPGGGEPAIKQEQLPLLLVHLPTHSRRAKHASARGPGTFCASRRAARAMNAAVLNRWPTPTPSSASNVE